jgi:hypothetical protein
MYTTAEHVAHANITPCSKETVNAIIIINLDVILVKIFLLKKWIKIIKNSIYINIHTPLKFICVALLHAICSIYDSNTNVVPGSNSMMCTE